MSLARAARSIIRIISPVKPSVGRFQPSLEVLDRRDVPALFTWTGAAGPNFNTPGSWQPQDFPPGQEHSLPIAGDEIRFQDMPLFGGSADCQDMVGDPGGPYASVILAAGYTGTVTLAGAVEAEVFHIHGGELAQAAAADMIVTEQFVWTDGDINVAGNAAALTISGAAAGIAPVDAGTVAIGSTLNVVDEAFLGIEPGTVDVVGGDGFFLENATVQAKSKNVNAYAKIKNEEIADRRFVIGKNAYYHVVRESDEGEALHHTALPIEITDKSGAFRIDGAIDATVSGRLGGNGPSVSSKGIVEITGGSVLRVPHGISLTGGIFGGNDINTAAVATKATLVGNLVNDGATVQLINRCGILRVEGDVTWASGEYKPRCTMGAAPYSDLWEATGTFTIGAKATVTPTTAGTIKQGDSWVVLHTASKFVGGPPLSGDPAYEITLGAMNGRVVKQ